VSVYHVLFKKQVNISHNNALLCAATIAKIT